MRICLYSHDFPPIVGGLSSFTANLARYLTNRGESVTVLTRATTPVAKKASYRVIRRPGWLRVCREVISCDVLHLNGFAFLPAAVAILTLRPIVWAHYEYDTVCPIGLAWWNGQRRTFSAVQCIRCMRSRGLTSSIPKRFVAMLLRRIVTHCVKVNVQPSNFIMNRQRQPRSVLVPHAVDVTVFNQSPPARDTKEAFLYCGRLVEEKGVQVLLRALQVCRQEGHDFVLRVRGEGGYLAELKRLVSSLGLGDTVTFNGFARGQELVVELKSAYALIVPSIWDEVTGIVAMEAMACGTPVIATDVGGLGELAAKGGLVVERSSVVALANAMILLHGSPTLREELSQSASQAIRSEYSLEAIGSRHLAIMRQLVTGMDRESIGTIPE